MKLQVKGRNQMELMLNDWYVFFSYQTPVVAIRRSTDSLYVTEKYWSHTTTRHINKYLADLNYPQDAVKKPQSFFDDLVGGA